MTTIRKWLCRTFCGQQQYIDLEPFPIQESASRITSSDIVALFDNANLMPNSLNITDREFKLVDIPHLREFLLGNPVSERKYVKERHDCDDFAYILQGDVTRWDSDLAFGIIHGLTPDGYGHAFNVCIGIDKEIYFVEPQNDVVQKPEGDWKIWLVVM